jgi:nitrogen PTS system EIIA component
MKVIELLKPERVLVDLNVRTPSALFARTAELMLPDGNASEIKTLQSALLAREKLGSTALGFGVAVPHSRIPGIKAPLASFVRLRTPLVFSKAEKKAELGNIDESKVDLVFAFVTPTVIVEPQLQLLAQIASLFDDAKALDQLRAAKNSQALFEVLNNWFLAQDFDESDAA